MGSDSADDWFRCRDCDGTHKATGMERFCEELECPKCGGVMEPEPEYRQ